ncbi:MAG: N-acetyl-gamma-glutamyl-phosphate reductase [Planctomycetota bacterium]|nr:N-acetyl-gamma-glutamyl-phosphate reductase [Planctomycetota bacterium]
MIGVKIIGSTGYGGLGIIEILLRHPGFKISAVAATQEIGKPLSAAWPYLEGYCDLPILAADSPEFMGVEAEAVVAATPDGVGQVLAGSELAAGRRFLDYSGDFRFDSPECYAEYAHRIGKDPDHKAPDLLSHAVYGLSELHREKIARAKLVGNPGCFAVSCILGLAPAVRNELIDPDGIVCDCKSGVSGSGKKPIPAHHYPERYDNMGAYRLSGHQHVMEIERELSLLAGREIRVTFTPQVAPLCRGIMCCLYGRLVPGVRHSHIANAYREFYAGEKFVLVRDASQSASTSDVRGGNRCLLTVATDERTGVFRVVSHIDNLMKGQAGSAAQNLNIMFGYPEDMGLDHPGQHP